MEKCVEVYVVEVCSLYILFSCKHYVLCSTSSTKAKPSPCISYMEFHAKTHSQEKRSKTEDLIQGRLLKHSSPVMKRILGQSI